MFSTYADESRGGGVVDVVGWGGQRYMPPVGVHIRASDRNLLLVYFQVTCLI